MDTNSAIKTIQGKNGQKVGDGQCYALTSYFLYLISGRNISYSVNKQLGGAILKLLKGGMNASDIGSDWNWSEVGWTVKHNPSVSDLRAGAIFNVKPNLTWQTNGLWTTSQYGHTGVITGVNGDSVSITHQNGDKPLTTVNEVVSASKLAPILTSVIYPPATQSTQQPSGTQFRVKVPITNLNVRQAPSLSAKVTGTAKQGVYTIVDTKEADGHVWGKLKSGLGWIALSYAVQL